MTIESVATAEEQEHFRLEVDEMSITLLPPNDARPDPVNVLRPGGSVLAAERWMTDCCWMSLVVQDQRPLFPDDMLADTVSIGHISWDVYDLTKRDFVAIEAVTTTDKVSISVAAQVRFPAETPAETAYNLVDQVIKTMAIQPK